MSFVAPFITRFLQTSIGFTLGRKVFNSLQWNFNRATREIANKISPGHTVCSGPFQGMRYPHLAAAGSEFLPKLAGTYEAEVQPILENLLARRTYTSIINIGCGEGYYAVGCALLLPQTEIFAFDTDPLALGLCAGMAAANHVAPRLRLHGECLPESLRSLALPSGPTLILCDCEGFEYTLLRPENLPFPDYDILVELHETTPGLPRNKELARLFSPTHRVRIIQDQPRDPARFPALATLAPWQVRRALDESRPFTMQWMLLESGPPQS